MNIDLMIQLGYVIAAGLFFSASKCWAPQTPRGKVTAYPLSVCWWLLLPRFLTRDCSVEYILGGMIVGGAVGAVARAHRGNDIHARDGGLV